MMENLEFEEEEKQFLAAEQDKVQEVPVSKRKPQEEVKSKIQRQITSLSSKRKNKFII